MWKKIKDDSKHSVGNMWPTSQVGDTNTTTEALFSGTNPPKDLKARKRQICIYCNGKHWSDKCKQYPTVTARKGKIKGLCFICLKPGHHQKDCKVNKPCVYCQQRNQHHGSLCINKFPSEKPAENGTKVTEPLSITVSPENTLLASDEQVLMQTATAEVDDLQKSRKHTIRLLLDTGGQRSYIAEQLAERLQLQSKGTETLTVYTFSTSAPRQLQIPVTELRLLTEDGSSFHLRVKTTGTLQRAFFDAEEIKPLLKDISLPHGQRKCQHRATHWK